MNCGCEPAARERCWDSASNYLRARYYDPSTAQFLSRDPLTTTTRQPYGYTGDNPLNFTDKSGLWFGLDDLA